MPKVEEKEEEEEGEEVDKKHIIYFDLYYKTIKYNIKETHL